MKIIVTGSLGNTGKLLTEKLVLAGHKVTVISSSEDKISAIEAMGANAAIGSLEDTVFLTDAFHGADAVYTLVPSNFGASNYREYVGNVGHNYATAIQQAGIKKVVNLSSIGAHLTAGTGPIAGLHDVEQILNALPDVDVKHLRAGFFYINFLNNIDMIKHMNIIGSNYGPGINIPMVHPVDIADAAAEEFQNVFTGNSVRYIVSDERSLSAVAAVLGAAIGKRDLKWVEFTDQQSLEGMEKAGMPRSIAEMYNEMGTAVRSGILFDDYKKINPPFSGKVKLEEFAVEFAGKY
jgi:uncharacterized protein YbjT (DUF2867 family)